MAEQNRVTGSSPQVRSQPGAARGRTARPETGQQGPSFAEVLRQQQTAGDETAVRFSGHAQARMASRGVTLSQQDLDRLGEAVGRAEERGGRESLVLLDDLALVVSVRNRTVITVVDGESRRGNVFTNIDSAVIV